MDFMHNLIKVTPTNETIKAKDIFNSAHVACIHVVGCSNSGVPNCALHSIQLKYFAKK